MLKERIDGFYKARQSSREKTAFYVSDAGKCPRAVWFSRKGYPKKPMEPRAMRVFEHGDHTHMRFMSALFSLGLVTAVEVSIPENEFIHGRADAIISIDGEPYVVELKSVNSFKFKQGDINPDHVKQLQLYLHFFKIKKGVLLYENKDNQELQEFLVEYDPEFVKKLLDFFAKLKEKVDTNEIPNIPADIERWRCEYCDYIESCEKAEAREMNKK